METGSQIHEVSPRDFSRRDVLVGGAALALTMTAPLMRPAIARERRAERLKVGIIGCGGRGTGAAIQALSADKDAVLWALGDVFQDRVDSFTQALQEHFADSPERLQVSKERTYLGVDAYRGVLDSGIDVVLLTGYPHFRPAHLEAAVEKGVHVFCEKPMAVDGPGLRRVRAAAAKAAEKKLNLVSGFCWRYNDVMVPFFERLLAGDVGQVLNVHSTYHTGTLSRRPRQPAWSEMEFQLRNWWHFCWISGDHIVEQAIHSIDRLAWAMGDADPLRCVGLGGRAARSGEEHGDVFDHFTVIYEYADGRRAHHTCRQIDRCPGDNTDYITCAGGRGVCDGFSSRYALVDHQGKNVYTGKKDTESLSRMYQNEHDELFRSIRSGKVRNDGEWMSRSTMMAIMGRIAAYTGQSISWDQAWKSEDDLTPASYAMGAGPAVKVPVPGVARFR